MKRSETANSTNLRLRQRISALLATGLLLSSNALVLAQTAVSKPSAGLDTEMTVSPRPAKPVRGQVAIARDVRIASESSKISLNMRDADLRDVLNMLAKQGNFNIVLDQSVEGTLTVDINNISINKALEYIFSVGDLSYSKDGNTLIVAARSEAESKNLNARTFKAIPVLYRDANTVATQLNNTLFSVPRPGGGRVAIAAADPDSNSLLIMGTDVDIKMVNEALRELDMPRNRKVYRIRHNQPAYVAQVIAANFFGFGNSSSNNGGSSASSNNASNASTSGNASSTTGSASNSTNTSSTSSSSTASGSSTTASGNSGASGSSSSSGGTGGGLVLQAGGVTFVSEPISGTLTVMGTDEQIALVDSIIDQVDVKRPQAAIEVALVEIQENILKNFVPTWGALDLGSELRVNLFANGTGSSVVSFLRQGFAGSAQTGLLESFSLNGRNQSIKAKVLANPTVVALDGTSSSINITDQIPTIAQSTTTTATGTIITNTITTTEAGVQLQLTPQIFNDGSVVLNLQPTVSQPNGDVTVLNADGTTAASTILVSTRSMSLTGVRVKDGQTLVIGGLLREGANTDIRKIPGLDKLPIVSAMFRSVNSNNKSKTELVLMVTPHIIKEDAVTYFDDPANATAGRYSDPNIGGIRPISLPKYMGSQEIREKQDALVKPAVDTVQPSTTSGNAPPKKIEIDTGVKEKSQIPTQETKPVVSLSAAQPTTAKAFNPVIPVSMVQVAEPLARIEPADQPLGTRQDDALSPESLKLFEEILLNDTHP